MEKLYASGVELNTSPECFGELRESNDILHNIDMLRTRLAEDGYLLLRGLIDADDVLKARREILLKYAIVGEIDPREPLMDAIHNADSVVDQVNLRALSESIRTGADYLNVVMNSNLIRFYERFLGGPVHSYDFRWPRAARPGEGCGFHYDGPYMNHGTERVYTSWIPLGDVQREEGSLVVLEDGHKIPELKKVYANKDADRDKLQWLGTDPVKLQKRFGGRWLTTDFRAGDVLCFTMHTLHGALDNSSPVKRMRLSSDTRYQLASEPVDERWNGPDPVAHGRGKVFFPGLGRWNNADFQDEWKNVDEWGRLAPLNS